jgi:hypothetical protein
MALHVHRAAHYAKPACDPKLARVLHRLRLQESTRNHDAASRSRHMSLSHLIAVAATVTNLLRDA